jgi:protein-disulfide isomerase
MRIAGRLVVVAALTLFIGVDRTVAQTAQEFEALKKQIETLVAGQQSIEKQLQEIRALLQAQGKSAAPVMFLNVDGAPTKGDPRAKVTIVEFSDYECPFCSRYTRDTWPLLEKGYVKTGKVKYVFRNFPIPALHKQAVKAHQAALCAGEQNKYWEMHDLLFANSPKLGEAALIDYAGRAGLNVDLFKACLAGGKHLAQIQQDMSEAKRAGMTGTPTFFLGLTPARGERMQVVRVLTGAQPYAAFEQVIDAMLTAEASLPAQR